MEIDCRIVGLGLRVEGDLLTIPAADKIHHSLTAGRRAFGMTGPRDYRGSEMGGLLPLKTHNLHSFHPFMPFMLKNSCGKAATHTLHTPEAACSSPFTPAHCWQGLRPLPELSTLSQFPTPFTPNSEFPTPNS